MAADPNYIGKDFLSLPKEHHHVSRLMVWCVVLGFIVVIGAVYGFYSGNVGTSSAPEKITASTPGPTVLNAPLSAELKASLERASAVLSTKTPATLADQKRASDALKLKKPATLEDQQRASQALLQAQSN